jgi:hypothetical protein
MIPPDTGKHNSQNIKENIKNSCVKIIIKLFVLH